MLVLVLVVPLLTLLHSNDLGTVAGAALSTWALAANMRDADEAPWCWLRRGPVLALVAI